MSSRIYTFLSLGLVLIIDSLVMGIVLPLLGPLFTNTTMSGILPVATVPIVRDGLYSLTMGVFFFFAIIGAPFLGELSDRIGRRRVLLISLFITGMSCLASAMAISIKSVALLILTRSIAGLSSGNQGLAQAAIIDISTPENKARNISFITLASCIGFVIGPIIGGVFSDSQIFKHADFSTPFFIAAVFALINAVCLLLTFRETFYPTAHKQRLKLSKGFMLLAEGFRDDRLKKWLLLFLIAELAWGLYFQGVSLLLSQADHYSTGWIGMYMSGLAIIFVVSLSVILPMSLKSFSLRGLIAFGLILLAAGLFMNGIWVHKASAHWLSLLPIGLGEAFVYTCFITLISNAVDKNVQGWAMGVAIAVGSLGWALGSVGLALVSASLSILFIAAALMILLCYILIKKGFVTVIESPKEIKGK